MSPEEFMNGAWYIHVTTFEQAENVLDYYSQLDQNAHNTVNAILYRICPWFYYSHGVHGVVTKPRGRIVEYERWADMAVLPDFKESDKPLSFLFESVKKS